MVRQVGIGCGGVLVIYCLSYSVLVPARPPEVVD
jgi:hypothetical protein